MSIVSYSEADVNLMARMMRAEAVGEGQMGMLFVGNVIVNRAKADCLDFTEVRSIRDVIFQVQGGNYSFEAVQKGSMFYRPSRNAEKRLARKNLNFWMRHPAKFALWYFNPFDTCPSTWHDQPFTGEYKHHCFYEPQPGTCASVYQSLG